MISKRDYEAELRELQKQFEAETKAHIKFAQDMGIKLVAAKAKIELLRKALLGLGKQLNDGSSCWYDNGCGHGPKHGKRCRSARAALVASEDKDE